MSKAKSKPQTKPQQALAYAREVAETAGDWIAFHNALFGIGGRCGELFPTRAKRTAFAGTDEWKEIMEIMGRLQDESGDRVFAEAAATANGRVLVRLPKSLHAALIQEAEAEDVPMNQLIVSKLSAQLRTLV